MSLTPPTKRTPYSSGKTSPATPRCGTPNFEIESLRDTDNSDDEPIVPIRRFTLADPLMMPQGT